MSYPRKYPTTDGTALAPADWNAMKDRIDGFTPEGYFVSPYSFVIFTNEVGEPPVTYYYACNAFQIVYGGPDWETISPEVDGTDAAAVIQAAITALGSTGGKIFIKSGTYLLSSFHHSIGDAHIIFEVSYSTIIQGEGESTILKVADGLVVPPLKGTTVFWVGYEDGVSDITFRDFVIDGNCANQNFSAMGFVDYFIAISGKSGSATDQELNRLVFENFTIKNFATGVTGTYRNGLGVDTFGALIFQASNFFGENNDQTFFLTSVVPGTSPLYYTLNNIVIKNPKKDGIMIEGISNVEINNVVVYADELSTAVIAGIRVFSGVLTKNLIISNGFFKNLGYPLVVGGGGPPVFLVKDSVFSHLTAYNCRGGFNFNAADSSDVISDIVAEHCGIGEMDDVTIWGSFEFGGGAITDFIRAENICSIDSQSHGIRCYDMTYILGGVISAAVPPLEQIYGAGENAVVKNVIGYATENSGTATITGAVTTVNVTHGLKFIPTKVLITPLQNGQGDCWVSSKNVAGQGLQFAIDFVTQPEANTWSFDWKAEI